MSWYYEYFTNNLGNILLTRDQVAGMLQVEESTLDLWDQENRLNLPEVISKGITKYHYLDVLEFLHKNKL